MMKGETVGDTYDVIMAAYPAAEAAARTSTPW